jgi:hypothetical protein
MTCPLVTNGEQTTPDSWIRAGPLDLSMKYVGTAWEAVGEERMRLVYFAFRSIWSNFPAASTCIVGRTCE